jgi:kynurenine formamidase
MNEQRSGGFPAAEQIARQPGRLESRPSTRIIDLTLTLRHGMRGVEIETAKTFERDGWNARTLHLYSHAGTHIDAQTHFAAGTQTIDQIPLGRCMGPAWVVNLDDIADKRSSPSRMSAASRKSSRLVKACCCGQAGAGT